ncbi:MAG: UDP-N-acetylglucosamine 1-carboxyvinyltransferase [Rickettsiales bacterium]|nr:UDP-N-acetylglucosamine 1-carboxyvinyltransferase [Rickettsiales bacterium]
MDRIEIEGGVQLKGNIKISGSKNASLPILAATLLTDEMLKISNVPELADVFSMINLLRSLNADISFSKNNCLVKPKKPKSLNVSYDLVRKMRASFLILGPLLSRYGYAEVSLPGGCAIGTRPVDIHLDGLESMGAKFKIENGYVKGKVEGKLKGAVIKLKKISVGATENLMMAATLAEGTSVLRNAAKEPEIVDLANFLIKMGADIKGFGTNEIVVKGKKKLEGCKFNVMPDRIEAGTFALIVLGCSGNIILENINDDVSDHLIKIFSPLKNLKLEKRQYGKKLYIEKINKKKINVKISTKEYPGFPTDLQAQLTASLIKFAGESEIKENIFENRFMHISELKRMGANLTLKGSKILINGVKEIYGAELMATDLRASSCLIIAGLMAKGKTKINRVYHLDRGYENIEKKLRNCGAKIKRISK